jgi:hypothetical protein
MSTLHPKRKKRTRTLKANRGAAETSHGLVVGEEFGRNFRIDAISSRP